MHSALFLDFLAGNQTYHCTPWGMPTRNIFGWQKPCYLLGEGYANSYTELMETTDWEAYGTGRYEKCANCMAHCGYEPTAVAATFAHPLETLKVALFGVRTEGKMAPEISLTRQRPAQYVFSRHVEKMLPQLRETKVRAKEAAARDQGSPRRPAVKSKADQHRYLPRTRDQRPDDRLVIDPAVSIGCDQRRWRQGAVRRIGDHAKRRERDMVLDGDARRYVGFHIDGNRARVSVKLALRFHAGNGRIGAGDVAERDVLQRTKGRCPHSDQRLRPRAVTWITAVFCDDVAGDHAGAGLEVRRQSAGDAETQHAVAALPDRSFERAPQLDLPSAANDGHAGAGHDTGLESQTRHRHKTWPVHTTQLQPPLRYSPGKLLFRHAR
jgi:hypothetical protein